MTAHTETSRTDMITDLIDLAASMGTDIGEAAAIACMREEGRTDAAEDIADAWARACVEYISDEAGGWITHIDAIRAIEDTDRDAVRRAVDERIAASEDDTGAQEYTDAAETDEDIDHDDRAERCAYIARAEAAWAEAIR